MKVDVCSSKTGKFVTIVVTILVIIAIAVPIYVSTLKNDSEDKTGSETDTSAHVQGNNGETTTTRLTVESITSMIKPIETKATTETSKTPKATTETSKTTNATKETSKTPKATTETSKTPKATTETSKTPKSITETSKTPKATTETSKTTTSTTTENVVRTTENAEKHNIVTTHILTKNDVTTAQEDNIYVSNGALTFGSGQFYLNGSEFRVVSGAVHYFRTVSGHWRDRLQKLKACGINTVETYVPWNLHEEYPGQFNFDGILDVRKFIQLAHELGLYVIFRPGPYICSEWDFGGLPAWLLSDPVMKVRTNYAGYAEAAERFFDKLLPMVVDLQYSNGGPIIAFQIENEFGSYSSDVDHLKFLLNLYVKHNLNELYLTSDNAWGYKNDPFYHDALPTANFQKMVEGKEVFDQIRAWSAEFPLMVTEFWTGWFDHWGSKHGGLALEDYEKSLTEILKLNASINFYMFHGGTNFGFMNGANLETTYKPDVTSYDYDCLLTENGDITPKYMKTRELLLEYVYKPQGITSLPDIPKNVETASYDSVTVNGYSPFENLLVSSKKVSSKPVPMEMLELHGKYGQNYGYILYRCEIQGDSSTLTFDEIPKDRAQIFVNGVQVAVLDWSTTSTDVALPQSDSSANVRVDILVENHGRVNYGREAEGVLNNERKGIRGAVKCDDIEIPNFSIFPLEFKPETVVRTDWNSADNMTIPGLFRASPNISDDTKDTFIYMKGWGKGIVFINGFNLGRYWSVGPQQTLYLPASLLKQGPNEIVIFEQEKIGNEIVFTAKPILDVNDQSEIKL